MKINRKSRNKRKSCKKMSRRKKSTTRKHKRCKKCFKGGMINPPLEECSLCLNEINIQDDGIMFRHLFNCAHDFHKECIIGWINTLKTQDEEGEFIFDVNCPLCRAELTDDGNHIIQTISDILDMNDRRTRRNMFRDLLQYDYPYDANEDTFFRLYIFPIPRITYDFVRDYVRYELSSNEYAVGRAGIFFFLSFVITGNDGRQTLTRYYNNFRTLQFFRGILNTFAVIDLPYNNEHINPQVNAVTNIFIIFIVLNFDNINTDVPTEINTINGIISLVNIITELINMFGRFILDNTDFGNYNPHLPDRQLGGASNATTIQNNKQSITFKITSMEDMKEFLDIVGKNKTKLESLLDKVPFTLSTLFPEMEYTPELVQKLRPLIKN